MGSIPVEEANQAAKVVQQSRRSPPECVFVALVSASYWQEFVKTRRASGGAYPLQNAFGDAKDSRREDSIRKQTPRFSNFSAVSHHSCERRRAIAVDDSIGQKNASQLAIFYSKNRLRQQKSANSTPAVARSAVIFIFPATPELARNVLTLSSPKDMAALIPVELPVLRQFWERCTQDAQWRRLPGRLTVLRNYWWMELQNYSAIFKRMVNL